MSSFARILWLIFLIAVPYLTAFLYILVRGRGRGIGERQAAAHDAARTATDQYIKDVAGKSPAAQIAEARALLDAGTITTAEYVLVVLVLFVRVVLFMVAAVSTQDPTMYDRIIGLIRVSRGAGRPAPDEGP